MKRKYHTRSCECGNCKNFKLNFMWKDYEICQKIKKTKAGPIQMKKELEPQEVLKKENPQVSPIKSEIKSENENDFAFNNTKPVISLSSSCTGTVDSQNQTPPKVVYGSTQSTITANSCDSGERIPSTTTRSTQTSPKHHIPSNKEEPSTYLPVKEENQEFHPCTTSPSFLRIPKISYPEALNTRSVNINNVLHAAALSTRNQQFTTENLKTMQHAFELIR